MKLTPRAQGWRFRHKNWKSYEYADVKIVGEPDELVRRRCEGINERGERIIFWTDESDAGWIRLGTTSMLKRKRNVAQSNLAKS